MIQKYKNLVPRMDETCYLAPGSAVIGDVIIGKNSSVWHNAVLRGDVDQIVIGENSNIQDGCLLHCIKGVKLRVGSNVSLGHGAILHSCEIGDNSLIGMGAIVLDRAKIGNNCLVGAGAVVTPNTVIPDGSLVIGSPGKVKRPLTEEEIEHIRNNAREYVRLASDYRSDE